MGAGNSGRYSNSALDVKLRQALTTFDEAKRNTLLAEASDIAFNDVALLPLHHEVLVAAARKGLSYKTTRRPIHAGDGRGARRVSRKTKR